MYVRVRVRVTDIPQLTLAKTSAPPVKPSAKASEDDEFKHFLDYKGGATPSRTGPAGPPTPGTTADGAYRVLGSSAEDAAAPVGPPPPELMLDFSKMLWMSDVAKSMRRLLMHRRVQTEFHTFLQNESNEQQLALILAADALEREPPFEQAARAVALRAQFLMTADGVGQQERTASTQQLWDDVGKSPVAERTSEVALAELRAEVGRDGVWRVSLP